VLPGADEQWMLTARLQIQLRQLDLPLQLRFFSSSDRMENGRNKMLVSGFDIGWTPFAFGSHTSIFCKPNVN